MDAVDINDDREDTSNQRHKTTFRRLLSRSPFAVLFAALMFVCTLFFVLYVAVFIENLSIWSPITVPSRCRIVSSSVDLRSSKICELGLLNYKAKHVFYPLERRKYRCHYDYYWASVFKVEYIDHSGKAKSAFAEAPNEALPSECRPNFGAAWLAKDKFKVNETYECCYTLGISKVKINHEGLFNCRAEDPSTVEMLRRYSILFTGTLKSSFSSWESPKQWRWEMIAGLTTGLLSSIASSVFAGLIFQLIPIFKRKIESWMFKPSRSAYLLKRACVFALYFSFVGWFAVQYLNRVNL